MKSSEGKLYFGGINGFNVFQPEQFVDNKYIPPVYVTDIRLPYQTDEQEVKKLLQLDKPLYMADKVTLSYETIASLFVLSLLVLKIRGRTGILTYFGEWTRNGF